MTPVRNNFINMKLLKVAIALCGLCRINAIPEDIQGLEKFMADGEWSDWGNWVCDAVCGHGKYFRKRQCIAIGDFGIPVCDGKSTDRNDEICEVPCPGIKDIQERVLGPTLTEYEKKALSDMLNFGGEALTRDVGESAEMNCSNGLTLQLLEKYAKSSLSWELNGAKLLYNITRMLIRQHSILEIWDLHASDTGVYMCTVHFSKRFSMTISVFTLIVVDNDDVVEVAAMDDLAVNCNSDVIGRVFSSLEAEWVINNTGHVLKYYGVEPADEINHDIISGVEESFSGLWVCVIRDGILNRKWATNAVNVRVKPRDAYWLWCRLKFILQVYKFMAVAACLVILKIIILLVVNGIKRKRRKKRLKELEAILTIAEQMKAKGILKSEYHGNVEVKGGRVGKMQRAIDKTMEDIILKNKTEGTAKRTQSNTNLHFRQVADSIVNDIRLKPTRRKVNSDKRTGNEHADASTKVDGADHKMNDKSSKIRSASEVLFEKKWKVSPRPFKSVTDHPRFGSRASPTFNNSEIETTTGDIDSSHFDRKDGLGDDQYGNSGFVAWPSPAEEGQTKVRRKLILGRKLKTEFDKQNGQK